MFQKLRVLSFRSGAGSVWFGFRNLGLLQSSKPLLSKFHPETYVIKFYGYVIAVVISKLASLWKLFLEYVVKIDSLSTNYDNKYGPSNVCKTRR